jgi:hypothetical protein
MLSLTYTAQSRSLSLFPGQLFEIGAGVIISSVISPVVTLESLFRQSMLMTGGEWLSRFVHSANANAAPRFPPYDADAPTLSPRVPYGDPALLRLTADGRASAASFPVYTLKKRLVAKLSAQGFALMRPRLANSLSLSACLRHIFNAPYPSMQRAFANITSDCIPLMYLDFDHGMITAVEKTPFAAFRLSPNFANAVGESLGGELLLTVAVVAKTLTENIECIRACIEAVVADEDFSNKRQRTLGELVETRTTIEGRFLELCPPRMAGISPETGEQWFLGLEKLLADARNPEMQPIEAIPWF